MRPVCRKLMTTVALVGLLALVTQLEPSGAGVPAARAASTSPTPKEATGKGAAGLLRRAVLTAAAAAGVNHVLKGVEGSLVYLSSEYESGTEGDRADAPFDRTRTVPRVQAGDDPAATMPPASAGSNGTPIPPPPPGVDGSVVAQAPVPPGPRAAAATATYVSGIALAPPGAPGAIKGAINAANTIVGRPYVWGGGHDSWYSQGYDCSGAVSFALAGGGFLASPLASGQLEDWGEPGPGRWLTVYASASHAYAVIAGLRWDTVGDARGTGPRWHLATVPPDGFVARHPPGF
jgi:cell wall-associated NlpC family hydrolase